MNVQVQLGIVLIIFLVIMGALLAVLGPSRLKSVIEGGFSDAFRR